MIESLAEICDTNFPFDTENRAFWIRYTFISDGDFTFRIAPSNEIDDIDFFVFQSENNDCTNLNTVRCMMTGENVGSDIDPACIGPTGLAFESTDVLEQPGCQDGDDNFLASLEVQAGEVYYLLISNFSNNGMNDFTIEHDGSALLSCEEPNNTSTSSRHAQSIRISPNPFLNTINFKSFDTFSEGDHVQIVDLQGRQVYSNSIFENNEIDLNDLNSGIYFISIANKFGELGVHKIVKR